MPASMIEEARNFATAKHAGQVRKHDGKPYIAHLDGVVAVLVDDGQKGAELIAAAFLHDTIEKTRTTYDELIERFGEHVAELVYWLTDAEEGSRKILALQTAWRLSRAPMEAKLIKLADIIDNGSAILAHAPDFGPTFADEKRPLLQKMAEVEGPRLLELPLFQKADAITKSAVRPGDDG